MHEVLPPCGTFHTFVSAAIVTDVTLVGLLVCVQSGVTLQVRVDLELCPTHVTNERRVACVGAEVHDQLTGVATGIRTDLTPGGRISHHKGEHVVMWTQDFRPQIMQTSGQLHLKVTVSSYIYLM